MSYSLVLLLFLGPPLVVLTALHVRDRRAGRRLPLELRARSWRAVVAALVIVALAYTTPWDNYLVATGVWWYDPSLVAEELVLGWVPLEEYAFFVLQTVATGAWLAWLLRRIPARPAPTARAAALARVASAAAALLGALAAAAVLVAGWRAGRYLALELVWALPPIALQLGFGADILWRWRGPIALALGTATPWLWLADALAIRAGTWTISPTQTTGILLPGGLPLEEAIFFLITNVLVAFGLTLVIARQSQERARAWPLIGPRLAAQVPGAADGRPGGVGRRGA